MNFELADHVEELQKNEMNDPRALVLKKKLPQRRRDFWGVQFFIAPPSIRGYTRNAE